MFLIATAPMATLDSCYPNWCEYSRERTRYIYVAYVVGT
jgi:hypothetical protein